MYRTIYVLTLMAQRKSAATPVRQHWSYHSSTPRHQYDHRNGCLKQLIYSHRWPSPRLQQLQCVSTWATTVPRQAINMTMVTWQHMYKATCVLMLMDQRKTAATPVHQHWSYHSSTSSHQYDHGNICTDQLVRSRRWPSAIIQQLQCASIGATTFPR